MDAETAKAFDQVTHKLHAHDQRFDHLDGRFNKTDAELSDLQVMLVEEFRRIDRRFVEQEHKMEQRMAHYFGLLKEDFDSRFQLLHELLVPPQPWKDGQESQMRQHGDQLDNHEIRIQILEKKS